MNTLLLLLATAVMTPAFEAAPIPCETEKQAFGLAKWDVAPADSRWVKDLGEMWSAGKRHEEFKRPWGWYFRRTTLRINEAAGDFTVTVNGRAVGESKGAHGLVEFDLTPHLKWFGRNELDFEIAAVPDGRPAFRSALLVSSHCRAPKQMRVETWLADDLSLGRFKVLDENGNVLKERELANPQLWSDELPVVCMTPMEHHWGWWIFSGTEYRAIKFGFRKLEIRDGKPWINGKPLVLKPLAKHRKTPGHEGRPLTFRAFLQDTSFIKSHNANAIYAEDYPHCQEWYELCDRDGIYVIARSGEATPAGRPCVLTLPEGVAPTRIAVPADREGLDKLKTALSPVKMGQYDWAKGTLRVSNRYTFIDFDRLDGYCWYGLDEAGKVLSRGPLTALALPPGGRQELQINGVTGTVLRVEFLLEDEIVVSRTFKKGK